jgi:hypothetical protein
MKRIFFNIMDWIDDRILRHRFYPICSWTAKNYVCEEEMVGEDLPLYYEEDEFQKVSEENTKKILDALQLDYKDERIVDALVARKTKDLKEKPLRYGYRPVGKVDTSKPPKGGTGVRKETCTGCKCKCGREPGEK